MKHPIPREALDDRLGFLGTSGSGKTYNAGTAVEILLNNRARVVIIDPLGVWWGLRLWADGKKPSRFNVAIFGGPHGDLPLTEHAGALIGETAATMAESCIIDLSELKTKAAERRFMVAFLETIYRKATAEPFHLIVDEADLFAPQRPSAGDEVLLGHMENIVRRGRVKGFIPWLISQRPAVLNKNVLSQVDGLLAFKLTSTQDRDALDAWIEGQADKAAGKAIKDGLPTLQIGQGVVWIPGRGVLEAPAPFPKKVTFDSSRTPKRGEKVKRRALKALDLGSLKERLATVDAEAKSSDPKALRAEIATLKAERDKLAKAKAPAAGVDPEAAALIIKKAEERGFEQAKRKLHAEMQKQVRASVVEALAAVLIGLEPGLKLLTEAVASAKKVKPDLRSAIAFEPTQGSPAAAARPISPAPPAPRRHVVIAPGAKPSTEASGDGAFNVPQMKVLRSLAMWRALGHDEPSREMVAAVAGYKPSTGNYGNLIGSLVTCGAVGKPKPGHLSLLADGVDVMTRDTGRELLLETLDRPQKKIVGALIDQGARTREEIAADTGYQPGTGNFGNLLGSLNTIGVTFKPAPGQVALSDWAQELLTGHAERLAA